MEHIVEDVLQHALYPHHLRQRQTSTQLGTAAGPTEPQQHRYRAAWDMPRRQLPKRASAHSRRGEDGRKAIGIGARRATDSRRFSTALISVCLIRMARALVRYAVSPAR